MLVIANGAFKSGSTWQRNLIQDLLDFKPLPEEYQSKENATFIKYDKLNEIVDSVRIKENNYLAKAHIFDKSTIEVLTRNLDDVRVFMIQRDIRDAIVSHYNHFINVRRFKPSFRTYYWLIGRFKAIQIVKYNRIWEPYEENVFHSTFEELKTNTAQELLKFANFLGVSIEESQIKEIIEKNSIERVREKSHRKWFFRKGQIGDHKNYLTPGIEKDLKQIQIKANFFDEACYFILFELRHKIF